jgi:WhiB family redox-sensing transcriptional regulator
VIPAKLPYYGACVDKDPELFFPVGKKGRALQQIEDAKAICRRCELKDDCLQWALETGQDAGVWGGMSEEERRALRRIPRRRGRPSKVELESQSLRS